MRTKIQILTLKSAITGALLFCGSLCMNGQSVVGAFAKSYEYEFAQNFKGAAQVLTDVYDEKSYEINLRLGWLWYEAADYSKSVTYYKRAIDLRPRSIEAHIGLSYPLSAMGNEDELIKNYENLLKIDDKNSTANYWLGYIYYVRKDMDKALQYTLKVTEVYPFDYDANFLLGRIYVAQGKITEGKEALTKAQWYNPSSTNVTDILKKL